jgi:hypothetical protein
MASKKAYRTGAGAAALLYRPAENEARRVSFPFARRSDPSPVPN